MRNNSYYELGQKQIQAIQAQNIRPTLLLHVCCAPCACDLLRNLSIIFDITIYYTNSNIYPKAEYEHRLSELKRYLCWLQDTEEKSISLIIPPYEAEAYQKELAPYQSLPEFSERCWQCYTYRMRKAFQYAEEHHYAYCATVMSVSRYKNAEKINEIGASLNQEYPQVQYLYTDFKKEKGEERANQLAKQLDLYRQPYCGCFASLKEQQARRNQKTESTKVDTK